MGCWNETCMLSRMPIFAGDIVRAGLVAMRRDWDTVHADGIFMPAAPLVKACYDDYGGVEDVSAPREVLDLYADLSIVIEAEPGEFTALERKYGPDAPDDMMGQLFDAVRHGNAYLVDKRPCEPEQKLPVFPILVLDRFWALSQSQNIYLARPVKDDITLRTRLPGKFAGALREGRLDEESVMVPHLKFQRFLSVCRCSWQPACGSGSQNEFEPEMAALAEEILSYRDDLRRRYD